MAIDDFSYIAFGFANYLIFFWTCKAVYIIREFLQ